MTEHDLKIIFFILLFLAVCIYVTYSNYDKRKKELYKRLKNSYGKKPKKRLSQAEIEQIAHYFENNKTSDSLDDITWNDLGMDEIFMLINNTNSSVGQECLYRMLREPVKSIDELKEIDRLAEYFDSNEEERIKIQKIFCFIGRAKKAALIDYIDLIVNLESKNNFIHYFSLVFLLVSIIIITMVNPVIGIVLLVTSISFSIITYYKFKAEVESYFVCVNLCIKLLIACDKIADLGIDELKAYNELFKEDNKKFSSVIKGSWLLESGNINGSIGEIVLDYLRMLTHVDLIKFNRIVKLLDNKRDDIYKLFNKLGIIEASISVASFRTFIKEYTKPDFIEGTTDFEVKDVYHPLIDNPVKNSIKTKNHVLMTGSNASGKSTFLRTIAVNALLSQTIYTSVCSYYKAPVYRIYSSMALKDNLLSKDSYYIVEIKSLKRILDAVSDKGKPVLCFVDEVLRGTNTVERIAASSSILKSISHNKAMVFAATHDIELTKMLCDNYDNYHFKEEITDDDVRFEYILNRGPATTRNAIRLLMMIGYDDEVINNATDKAKHFMETGMW